MTQVAEQRLSLGSRRVRLKTVWLLLVPFFLLARPTPELLAVGAGSALLGLFVRAWAAGSIRKDRELAVSGPYAHTRNPLYLGSFFIGTGATVAGGRWTFVLLFLLFFFVVYRRAIRSEEANLEDEFGERYRRYRRRVPFFLPRPTPFRPEGAEGAPDRRPWDPSGGGFSLDRYLRNREWEALLGVVVGFALLYARMVWPI